MVSIYPDICRHDYVHVESEREREGEGEGEREREFLVLSIVSKIVSYLFIFAVLFQVLRHQPNLAADPVYQRGFKSSE